MSIVKQDAFGFTVGGSFRGTELPQVEFSYSLFVATQEPNPGFRASMLGLWAIRNGVSQAMTDSVALGKDSPIADAVDSWNEKAASLLAGKVPTSGAGGPRISPLERECRMVMVAKLTNTGMSTTDATKIAKNWKAFLSDKASEKAKLTGEDQATIFEVAVLKIETAANAVLDARKTPTADDLV